MTGSGATRPGGSAAAALAITLAIQIYVSAAATATAVLAPEIGRDLGVPPKLIGAFVGIVHAGSMIGSLVSGMFIARHGPIRVSQFCVGLCAIGTFLVAASALLPGAALLALAIAPLVIGLGYGPITPASSDILARTAPPSRMALTFSIKQTGVPAGAALAGATLPILALGIGWHEAFAVIAGLGILVALTSQIARASLDAGRAAAPPPSFAGIVLPLRELMRSPALVELALVGFIYAALQISLVTFTVVYLTESLGMSLVAAGLVLTVANVGGIVGRIAWGGISDWHVAPRQLLGLIGLASGVCACATAAFDTRWPLAAILATSALFGATAIGWNGVQLAEIARRAPADRVGAIMGASGFIGFAGVMIGPLVFALIAALTGGYRTGFVAFGGLTAACGLRLMLRHRK